MSDPLVYARVESPLGPLTLIGRDGALVGVRFRPPGPRESRSGREAPEALGDAIAQLAEYFAGRRRSFELTLAASGDRFERRVWDATSAIPYGRTESYGTIAARLGLPAIAARDVGVALARNPLPVIVPCHRVVGADGSLTGYGGGLERKAALLALEAPSEQLSLDVGRSGPVVSSAPSGS
jgi:methylated-DNA-[protein]-cysteine S-methyltransferase